MNLSHDCGLSVAVGVGCPIWSGKRCQLLLLLALRTVGFEKRGWDMTVRM